MFVSREERSGICRKLGTVDFTDNETIRFLFNTTLPYQFWDVMAIISSSFYDNALAAPGN